jgi:polysaccharide export outer membrane protein
MKEFFPRLTRNKYWPLWVIVSWLTLATKPILAPAIAAQPSSPVSLPKTLNSTAIAIAPTIQETPYTLGAGDRLRVDILNVPEYSGEQVILVDGTISLPIIGRIQAQGLTINELSQQVSQKYGNYIKRAIASVTLLQPRPAKIAISGEVNNPGSYTLDLTEQKQFPSITGLVNLAGGLTTTANMRQVEIRRSFKGKEQLFKVDLGQLIEQANLAQDITLRDGDRIFIPTKTNIDIAETNQIAYANFGLGTFKSLNVVVVGEVVRPGSYKVEREEERNRGINEQQPEKIQPPRLIQAIQLAGGIKPLADIHGVEVRRLTRNGSQQVIKVDLWQLLQKGDINQNLILQDGDTIFIPTADSLDVAQTNQLATVNFGIRVSQPINVAVVGEVLRPGSYQIKPGEEGQAPRITQAIQTASGIKPMADIRQVELRRFTSSGSQQTFKVDLWQLLQKGDINQDLILQEGDTIIIPTATALNPNEAVSLAEASFAPAKIKVNVVGEVNEPGTVEVPPNTPLNQALLAAGGFDNRRAKKSSVELIRLNPNGTVSQRRIQVDLASGINEENNPSLRENDVIVVNRSGITAFSDTVGEALRPVGSVFSVTNLLRIFGLTD